MEGAVGNKNLQSGISEGDDPGGAPARDAAGRRIRVPAAAAAHLSRPREGEIRSFSPPVLEEICVWEGDDLGVEAVGGGRRDLP